LRPRLLPDRSIVIQFGPGFGQKDNSGPKKFQSAVLWKQWRLVHGTELYDINMDREQKNDIAAANPDIVADLRQRYETWWRGVEPRLQDFVPANLGMPQEPSVIFTSADWQDAYVDNSNHIRNAGGGPRGGPWHVQVERAGNYEIVLRRWPFEFDVALDGNVQPPGKALPIASSAWSCSRRLTACASNMPRALAPLNRLLRRAPESEPRSTVNGRMTPTACISPRSRSATDQMKEKSLDRSWCD